MNRARPAWSPLAFLGGLAVLALLVLGVALPSSGFYWVDFPVFYTAAQKALAHKTVYDVVGHFQFKYSPFTALVFGWLWGWVPFAQASWVFQKCMLALYVLIGGTLCWRSSWTTRGGSLPRTLETAGVLLFWLSGALILELKLGQINAIVLALTVALFDPRRLDGQESWIKNPILRGLLFSLAFQIKLYVLLFGVLLVLRRQWLTLAAAAVWTGLLCGGVLSVVHGPEMAWSECVAWVVSLTHSSSDLITHHTNAGLLGVYSRAVGRFWGGWLWVFSLSGYFGLLWIVRGSARRISRGDQSGSAQEHWEMTWALLGIVLFNPLVWSYWVLLLLPILAPLARTGLDHLASTATLRKKAVTIGCAVVLALSWNFQQAHVTRLYGVLAGTLLVGVLSLQLPRRRRGTS